MSKNIPVLGSPWMRVARPVQITCMILWFPLACATVLLGLRVLRSPDVVFATLAAVTAVAILVVVFTWVDGDGIVRELAPGDLAKLRADIGGEPDLVEEVGKYLAAGRILLTSEAAALRHEVLCRRNERRCRVADAMLTDGDEQARAFFTGVAGGRVDDAPATLPGKDA